MALSYESTAVTADGFSAVRTVEMKPLENSGKLNLCSTQKF